MDLKNSEKLYFSITEVSKHFNVSPSLLRYWESEFPQINPKRKKKDVRFYSKKDIAEIEKIYDLVKVKGFTLAGAKTEVKKRNTPDKKKGHVIETLKELRAFLKEAQANLS
jgi:DNA-binding transcriptional MerR regulator